MWSVVAGRKQRASKGSAPGDLVGGRHHQRQGDRGAASIGGLHRRHRHRAKLVPRSSSLIYPHIAMGPSPADVAGTVGDDGAQTTTQPKWARLLGKGKATAIKNTRASLLLLPLSCTFNLRIDSVLVLTRLTSAHHHVPRRQRQLARHALGAPRPQRLLLLHLPRPLPPLRHPALRPHPRPSPAPPIPPSAVASHSRQRTPSPPQTSPTTPPPPCRPAPKAPPNSQRARAKQRRPLTAKSRLGRRAPSAASPHPSPATPSSSPTAKSPPSPPSNHLNPPIVMKPHRPHLPLPPPRSSKLPRTTSPQTDSSPRPPAPSSFPFLAPAPRDHAAISARFPMPLSAAAASAFTDVRALAPRIYDLYSDPSASDTDSTRASSLNLIELVRLGSISSGSPAGRSPSRSTNPGSANGMSSSSNQPASGSADISGRENTSSTGSEVASLSLSQSGSSSERYVTTRVEHIQTTDGHHVITGNEGKFIRCEEEVRFFLFLSLSLSMCNRPCKYGNRC